MGNLDTYTVYAFQNESLLASGTVDSPAIKLNDYKPDKENAVAQVHSAGASSVLKLECLVSNDGVLYSVPVGTSDIVTAHGPGDGHYTFVLPIAKYLKIRATETGTTNPITDLDVLIGLR